MTDHSHGYTCYLCGGGVCSKMPTESKLYIGDSGFKPMIVFSWPPLWETRVTFHAGEPDNPTRPSTGYWTLHKFEWNEEYGFAFIGMEIVAPGRSRDLEGAS